MRHHSQKPYSYSSTVMSLLITAAACKAHCRASGDQGNEGESSEGSETDQDSEEDKGKPSQAWPPGIRYSPSSSRYISALLYSDAQMGVLSYNRCVTSIILPEEVKQAIEKKEKNRFSSDTINTIANEDISVDSIFIGVTETAARNSSLNSSQHSSQSQSSDDSNDHDSMESSEERLFMEEVHASHCHYHYYYHYHRPLMILILCIKDTISNTSKPNTATVMPSHRCLRNSS